MLPGTYLELALRILSRSVDDSEFQVVKSYVLSMIVNSEFQVPKSDGIIFDARLARRVRSVR